MSKRDGCVKCGGTPALEQARIAALAVTGTKLADGCVLNLNAENLARLTDGGLDLPRRNAVAEACSNRRQLLSALIIGRPEQTVFFSHFMKCEMLSLEIDRCTNPAMNKGAVK
jgi:hypothetical protein